MSARSLAAPAFLAALLALAGPAGSETLLPYTNLFTGSWAQTVAIGDVNGDGRGDVVVGTANTTTDPINDSRLHVFLQNADGSLASRVRYFTGLSALGVAIGDLNGDARNDVAVVGTTGLAVFRQTSTGTLAAPTIFNLPLAPDSVAIGDVNGDGRGDVVLSMVDPTDFVTFRAVLRIYYQTAAGALGTPVDIVVTPGRQDEVEIGDLNGDGRADIAFMRGLLTFQGNVELFRQTATGALVRSSLGISQFEATHGIEIADVTGQGRQDLLFTIGDLQPDTFLGVFPQLGTGALDNPVLYVAPSFPLAVEAGDVNGDGLRDAVLLHPSLGNVSLFLQLVGGTFDSPEVDVVPFAASALPQALAVGDINSDGRADVAVAHPDFGLVLLRSVPASPAVLAVSPGANQTGVVTNTTVQATFNQPMQAASINTTTFQLRGPAGLVADTVSYQVASRIAVFTPSQLLAANTTFTARLAGGAGGVQSAAGLPLPRDFTWSFTTGAGGGGNQPPVVSITNPPHGATIKGLVLVQAAASDPDGRVVRVEFLLDGLRQLSDSAAPFAWAFDTRLLSVREGQRRITARAVDDGGLAASASITVTIDNTTFDDVPKSAYYWAAVEAIYREGITVGCQRTPPLYCPSGVVNRALAAMFIVRALGASPLDSPTPTFADVPKSYPFYGYVERVAQLGIAMGCQLKPVRLFCPFRNATRAEITAFLVRAIRLAPYDNPVPTFADVPRGDRFYVYIEAAYRARIVNGCSTVPLLFCPTSPVTRGDFALLLVKAFQIPTGLPAP